MVFLAKNLLLLLLGAVLFCVLSAFFNKKSGVLFMSGIIITILFCMIGFGVQNSAVMKSNIPADVLPFARSLSLAFGFAFPMVLGGLAIASYERTLQRALLVQGVLAAVFLVLAVVLDLLMIVVFRMGTQGFSIANLICAVVIFALSLLTNKGFQKLITPKKLA